MSTEYGAPVSKGANIVGWIMTALPALILVMSATTGVFGAQMMGEEEFKETFEHSGFSYDLRIPLAIVQLGCVAVYLFPRTSVLGAILIAAYMGGAVATHVRLGEPFYIPIVFGVVAWGGLFLRDPRVRDLIPIYKKRKVA